MLGAIAGVSGYRLDDASAPSVGIRSIPVGNEGTTVQLSANIGGGAYDEISYLWSTTGGTLDDENAVSPTLTRPQVSTNNETFTVTLSLAVRGTGQSARRNTSQTVEATRDFTVSNVLPVAAVPAVSIDTIPAGLEGTTVRLTATLTGGLYDTVEYAWTVTGAGAGNALDDATLASPTLTRATVSAQQNYTARLTVTVRGTGTLARAGTSAAAGRVNRGFTVNDTPPAIPAADAPNVTIDNIPDGNEGTTVRLSASLRRGTYDTISYAWTTTGGTLTNEDTARPTLRRPTVASDSQSRVSLVVTVEGTGTNARNGTTDSSSRADKNFTTLDVPPVLPNASAPSLTIGNVPAGASGTISATVTGGTYDTIAYAWTATGGTLTGANTRTATWTKPTARGNYTIRCQVTVTGTGTRARNGTSDDVTVSKAYSVTLPNASVAGLGIGVQLRFESDGGGIGLPSTSRWRDTQDGGEVDYSNTARHVRWNNTTSSPTNDGYKSQPQVSIPSTLVADAIDVSVVIANGFIDFGRRLVRSSRLEGTYSPGTRDKRVELPFFWYGPTSRSRPDGRLKVEFTITARGTGTRAASGSSDSKTVTLRVLWA